MKPFLQKFYVSIFLVFTGTGLALSQKVIVADSLRLVIDGQLAPFSSIQPGDTILLTRGLRPFIIIKNIHGTAQHPVVICNKGEVEINSDHYFGISIRQSSHLKLTGKGEADLVYGIRIFNRVGSGLCIGDYSTFIEAEGIEVGYSQFSGIVAKTEPPCGFTRSSFIQEKTVIHDCYVHHTGTEGMYIGSSFYNGQTIVCNGAQTSILPPLLKGVEVYNNLVTHTGWDGIQVSSAIDAKIHHNQIHFDSQMKADWQMTGIILGEGSTGEIYNNEIKDGEGTGIFSNGLGDIYIYNNKIIRPGKNNDKPSGRYGMYVDDKSSISGMYFYLFNNLIVNSNFEGIRFLNSQGKLKSHVVNNIVIRSDITPNNLNNELIHIVGENASTGSNFITSDLSLLRFQDPENDNFNIETGSLLIDAGQTITFKKISNDFNDQPRKQGNAIDIGPLESNFERDELNPNTNQDMAFPNPVKASEKITISFINPSEGWIEFQLVDRNGGKIKNLDRTYFAEGLQYKTIEASSLREGLNFIQITKRLEKSIVKISIYSP